MSVGVAAAPLPLFSHYPAPPAPVPVRLTTLAEHPCSYLPGRASRSRAFLADRMPGEVYHRFMDAGFRRSGRLFYQPACAGCRACVPVRVPVEAFRPDKSQRRCARRNADLRVSVAAPRPTDEAYALYVRYLRDWHGRAAAAADDGDDQGYASFVSFLYDSPVDTLEFRYRDPASGRLLAVGICDVCDNASLSSVYFFFDPAESARGLGTYGALHEIGEARRLGVPYYYLGFWVGECREMRYKTSYRPCELLGADGVWRPAGDAGRGSVTAGVAGDATPAAG